MGVPSLFRWLQSRYPCVTSDVVEVQPTIVNGLCIPVDFSKPNPNGIEFDNLYLDMNGIIHPCSHPIGKPAPETEDDMYIAIFEYIDRIMAMVRPRNLLFMAIDGVAPRAKMNYQHSLHFRAAEGAVIVAAIGGEGSEKNRADNPLFEPLSQKNKFDSNCITPGTPFMANLLVTLRYYIQLRLNTDPGWRGIKVILSDASTPGEGEHKVMDFIRRQRCDDDYNANTRHVLYGLDADLIFLGLATHEPHFYILRENVFAIEQRQRQSRGCDRCGLLGHTSHTCTGRSLPTEMLKEQQQQNIKNAQGGPNSSSIDGSVDPYLFFHCSIMREYLNAELYFDDNRIGFSYDFERVVDDWVFLCFFVGNDFLPHMPALEIREGAIDLLTDIYRDNLKRMGGYLTDNGELNIHRVKFIFKDLARLERIVFSQRAFKEESFQNANKHKRIGSYRSFGFSDKHIQELTQLVEQGEILREHGKINEAELIEKRIICLEMEFASELDTIQDVRPENRSFSSNSSKQVTPNALYNAEALAVPLGGGQKRKDALKRKANEADLDTNSDFKPSNKKRELDEPMNKIDFDGLSHSLEASPVILHDNFSPDDELSPSDNESTSDVSDLVLKSTALLQNRKFKAGQVRLDAEGYVERYYNDKFENSSPDFRRNVGHSYIEGLAWVLHYYIKGCPSWKWYYPYHYSPFASDITDLDSLSIKFDLGLPFRPIEQLMGVFPPASRIHIPAVFHSLMTEETSPIIDFYPNEFTIDLNGKRHSWQGVALLPFIDEKRLLSAMEPLYSLLSDEDNYLNSFGQEILMVSQWHPCFPTLCHAYSFKGSWIQLPMKIGCIGGLVQSDSIVCVPGATLSPPFPDHLDVMRPIKNLKSISVLFQHPQVLPSNSVWGLLSKVTLPPESMLWAEKEASFRRSRQRNPHILIAEFGHIRMVPPRSHPVFSHEAVERASHSGSGRGRYHAHHGHHARPRPLGNNSCTPLIDSYQPQPYHSAHSIDRNRRNNSPLGHNAQDKYDKTVNRPQSNSIVPSMGGHQHAQMLSLQLHVQQQVHARQPQAPARSTGNPISIPMRPNFSIPGQLHSRSRNHAWDRNFKDNNRPNRR